MEKKKSESDSKTKSRQALISDILHECDYLTKYNIDEKNPLGQGSFGCVFSALEKKSNNSCAIKICISDSNYFENTKDEILNLFALPHSHIIKPIDFYLDKKKNYVIIVMEKANISLCQLVLQNETGLEAEYIIQIILDLLTALDFANSEKGISHSDIKLSNILVFTDIDREQQKDAQKIFVKEKRHLFKLGDWGNGKMAGKSIDHTTLWTEWIGGTMGYAAPEIISQEKEINLAKADIYSLGLCMLACCGVKSKEFAPLSQMPSEEDHREYLEKTLMRYEIEKRYGKGILHLLKSMICFKSKKRFEISRLFLAINEILKEINEVKKLKVISEEAKANLESAKETKNVTNKILENESFLCVICMKNHQIKELQIIPNCEHQVGLGCLESFYKDQFSKNKFYVPKCPQDECRESLNFVDFKKISNEKTFKKYFYQCEKCELVSYKSIFIKMTNCHHKFCKDCFREIKNGKKKKCPIKKCHEEIDETSIQEYNRKKGSCFLCNEELGEKPFIFLDCCSAKFCDECLKNLLKSEIDGFQTNEEKKQSLFCIFCRKNLNNDEIEEALGSKLYKKYMRKYQKRNFCEICKIYHSLSKFNEMSCNHNICNKCMGKYIQKELQKNRKIENILCPSDDCLEKLTKNLINKFLENNEILKGEDKQEKIKINDHPKQEIKTPRHLINEKKDKFEECKVVQEKNQNDIHNQEIKILHDMIKEKKR